MPLKTDTETAADKVEEDGGDTLKLTDLPVEALASITSQSFDTNSADLDTIFKLANSSKELSNVFRQWTCCVCDGEGIFMVDDTTGKLALRKDPDGNVTTFSCVTCGKKYCGQPNCVGREDRRKCTGCKGFECWECSDKSSWNCPYCCKFSPHCLKCQGGESTKGCNLCGFSVCDKHAKKCDTCGIQVCGIHDFNVDICSFCNKGLCPDCHGHGDVMDWCDGCQKKSCRKGSCRLRYHGGSSLCSECWEEANNNDYDMDYDDMEGNRSRSRCSVM